MAIDEPPFGPEDMTLTREEAADRRRLGREMQERAKRERRAYRAGLAGEDPPDPSEPDSVHQAYQGGLDEAAQAARPAAGGTRPRSSSSSSSSAGPRGHRGPRGAGGRRGSAGRSPRRPGPAAGSRAPTLGPAAGGGFEMGPQGASFLLGVVGYALVLSYALYGWSGVTGWLSAKFLNKVTVKGGATVTPAPAGQGAPGLGSSPAGQPGLNAQGTPVRGFTVNPTTGGPTP